MPPASRASTSTVPLPSGTNPASLLDPLILSMLPSISVPVNLNG
jgi:hypothetical protein